MAKSKVAYVCDDCGADYAKWQGQCTSCQSWNTLTEVKVGGSKNEMRANRAGGYAGVTSKHVKLKEVKVEDIQKIPTGFSEFDRVLGGGLTPGSSNLIGGNPGAGKSTLLLQAASNLVEHRPFYVTGEESLDQVASRDRRLKLEQSGEIDMMAETNLDNILDVAAKIKPKIMIIDSIQSVYTPDTDSAPGSTSQVRDCATIITRFAKQNDCSVFMVGHMTKDSNIAGPNILKHIVDGVFEMEGTSDTRYRMLRSVKNRFGQVNELGCFAMMETGLKEVSNPSAIFLSRPEIPTSGSVVTTIWEGTRPVLLEIQVLADENGNSGSARRFAQGLDGNRISMLLAVVSRHAHISAADIDVFVNVVGGMKITETASDMAVVSSFYSSFRQRPIPQDVIVMGEIGLSGEVRPVQHGPERLREAAKHGFKRAIVPKSNATKAVEGMQIAPVTTVSELLEKLDEFSD